MRLDAEIDPTKYPISGYARAALERGGNAGDAAFSCPLISHIEGNLWMGGCIEGVRLPDDFRYVFSLYDGQEYIVGADTVLYERRQPLCVWVGENAMFPKVMRAFDVAVVYNHALYFRETDGLAWSRARD